MINRKEIISLLAVLITLSVSLTLFREVSVFPRMLLTVFLVVLINVIAKKVMSFYLESEIEITNWTVQRYGFKPGNYLKKPFQMGIFLPLITSLLTLGNFIWMAVFTFDVKPKVYRAAKRHGLYSYSEMTENHIGLIAAAGVAANLLFAVVGYLIGFREFAAINVYLAFFNMVPLSDLDGNKILFGNFVLWSFLAALALIGIGYVFFLV